MKKFGIGQPLSRLEDKRLLTGGGVYIDDRDLPHQAHAVFLRSPHAHARLGGIDTARARELPGVLAVYTGEDVAADGLGTTRVTIPRKRPDGSPLFARPHPGLARGAVRYVGDPVAMIVAESIAIAKDAADLIDVAYDPLPSVTSTEELMEAGTAPVWEECPDNISHVWEVGDAAATEAAFARAAHRIKRRYVVTRVHAQFMEPRGVLGAYDTRDERYTLYADVQYPHRVREMLANSIFKVPLHRVRVVTGDVGGAFGTKGWQYVEHRLVLWAAKKLGRPVKWSCERSEVLLADEHGRDSIADVELALDDDGRFLALRAGTTWNIGAYLSSDRNMLQTFTSLQSMTGCYDIPAAHVGMRAVFSNSPATAPYRGAGRPEAMYLLERIVDDAAREFGFDRVELRRRNLVPASAQPYRNTLGFLYDTGDYPKNLDMALALGDVAGFAAREDAARKAGRLRGLGIASVIEHAAPPGPEYAEVSFDSGGTVTLRMGTKNQGQGHQTIFTQILHETLGIDPADLRYVDGDTDAVTYGIGTMGSRSTVIGGTALRIAADKIVVKAKKIAAHMLEASEDDVEFADGAFTVAGTDRSLELREVAKASFLPPRLPPGVEPGLSETGSFSPERNTFPNGCHVCEVEIEPETGVTRIEKYVVVDDVGTVVNPKTLKGQIHGGVVQGLGQIFMEKVEYDPRSGQLMNASFMDYAVPRADDVCGFGVESNPCPTPLNPLGAKGAGEAGTVGAMPAAMNAVMDALSRAGVRQFDMPATPFRVWLALTSGETGKSGK